MNRRCRSQSLRYSLKEREGNKTLRSFGIWFRQKVLGKFEIPYLEVFITTKCNLRCEKCSSCIPYLKAHRDWSKEQFISDLEAVLEKTDRLYRLKLHGGEVFLNPDLPAIIEYVKKQKKILSVRLTTNGTVIPDQKILEVLRGSRVVVQISDYPLENTKRDQLVRLLEKNRIRYVCLRDQVWQDMGDFSLRSSSRYELCSIRRCTSMYDGRIHVCSRAAVMREEWKTGGMGIPVHTDRRSFRRAMRRLYKKKDDDACMHCDGDTEFAPLTEAGKQL